MRGNIKKFKLTQTFNSQTKRRRLKEINKEITCLKEMIATGARYKSRFTKKLKDDIIRLRQERKGIFFTTMTLSREGNEYSICYTDRLTVKNDKIKYYLYDPIIDVIRTKRRRQKRIRVGKVGGIRRDKGFFLRKFLRKFVDEYYINKKPQDNKEYVGIELEFYVIDESRDSIAPSLHTKYQELKDYVTVTDDGSLRPKSNEVGVELKILCERGDYSNLEKVLEVINDEFDTRIGTRCGMHIHLDCRNKKIQDTETSYYNLVSIQDILFKTQPSYREHEYCRRAPSRMFQHPNHLDKYKIVTDATYDRMKTIEVRAAESSLNYEEIVKWINFLHQVFDYEGLLVKMPKDTKELASTIKMTGDLEIYVENKVQQYTV